LQRAYDQLIHDVALQELDVTFALDRAGLVGEDGPTHSGNYDIAYLRCIPNLVIMTPANENETRLMLSTAYNYNGPATVRYPRGSGPNVEIDKGLASLEIGKANLVKEGSDDVIFLNFGSLLHEAIAVCENLNLTLIDMRFVKPLDENILRKYLSKAKLFVSLEDGSIKGGAGSSVQEFCAEENIIIKSKLLGIPDKFIDHASREEMIDEVGLTAKQIEETLQQLI
jgi:1-deoxy-D-xylulose-5-phosphate synthase